MNKKTNPAARSPGAMEPAPPRTVGGPRTSRWQWRTFPVFVAFVSGLLIASVINGQPSNVLAAAVQIGALFGVIYALVHLFVTNVIVAGRAKRRQQALERGDDPDDQWEEEAVYTDPPPAR